MTRIYNTTHNTLSKSSFATMQSAAKFDDSSMLLCTKDYESEEVDIFFKKKKKVLM